MAPLRGGAAACQKGCKAGLLPRLCTKMCGGSSAQGRMVPNTACQGEVRPGSERVYSATWRDPLAWGCAVVQEGERAVPEVPSTTRRSSAPRARAGRRTLPSWSHKHPLCPLLLLHVWSALAASCSFAAGLLRLHRVVVGQQWINGCIQRKPLCGLLHASHIRIFEQERRHEGKDGAPQQLAQRQAASVQPPANAAAGRETPAHHPALQLWTAAPWRSPAEPLRVFAARRC